MRRDGLRIDPKARPYGMQALDLVAEQVGGIEVVLPADPPEHVRALMAGLGVRVVEDASLPRSAAWKWKPQR